MAKPAFLKVLEPLVLGAGAAFLGPEIFGALGAGEAAAAPAAAAAAAPEAAALTTAEAAPFLIPGTETALAAAPEMLTGTVALPELTAAGAGAAPGILSAAAPSAAAEAAGPILGEPFPAGMTDVNVMTSSLAGPSAGTLTPPAGEALTTPAAAPTQLGTVATAQAPSGAGAALPSGTLGGESPDLTASFLTESGVPASEAPGVASSMMQYSLGGDAGTPSLTAAEGGGVGGKIGDIAGKAGEWVAGHPGALLSAALMGPQLLKGPQKTPYPAETNLGQVAQSAQQEQT